MYGHGGFECKVRVREQIQDLDPQIDLLQETTEYPLSLNYTSFDLNGRESEKGNQLLGPLIEL